MIDSEARGGVTLARLTDKRLDAAAAPGFKTGISALIEGGADRIVLDLTAVSFVDSSGLGAIVSALKQLGSRGDLVLAGLQPPVRKLLQLTRLDRVFKTYDTAEDAVAALG
ncbi:MAG TPA: STAS domain-containing protein [Azospirillaceae bacterium]|nr:STAS domain-containing protein [Azospirillaceae bacterium]